jgi:hypothetical protein
MPSQPARTAHGKAEQTRKPQESSRMRDHYKANEPSLGHMPSVRRRHHKRLAKNSIPARMSRREGEMQTNPKAAGILASARVLRDR